MKKIWLLATLLGLVIVFVVGCTVSMERQSPQRTTPVPGWSARESIGPTPSPSLPDAGTAPRIERAVDQPRLQWSLPMRDEEVWFISRGPIIESSEEVPGSGTLTTLRRGSRKPVPLPLKHTDVNARVDGYIGTVEVTQTFHNPYDSKIEAVYVFPLPQDAAVNEFLMIIGERRIRGIIRERKEAERLYKKARSQGYVASLMTEERPNIFTQSVANIEPGCEMDVKINYFHTLPYVDGWYEFVFPMVVG